MKLEWPADGPYGLFDDTDWQSMFPRSSGFLTLGPNDKMFYVSMYHQLHCVAILRQGYVTAKAGALVWPGNGTRIEHHVVHCLAYLREMALCHADPTLEIGELILLDGRKQHGIDGTGIAHRCRDWTKVRDYVDDNFGQRLAKGIVDEDGNELNL
jgi:hypothetical protein